jgi:sec-independent protein translocase protein TatA
MNHELRTSINQSINQSAMLLFIGATEVIFIMFAVLLIFGSKKIPEVARAMGKGFREFQKATDEIKRDLRNVENETQINTPNTPPPASPEEQKDTENQ